MCPTNNERPLAQIMIQSRAGNKSLFLTNDGLFYWSMYASIGHDDLNTVLFIYFHERV